MFYFISNTISYIHFFFVTYKIFSLIYIYFLEQQTNRRRNETEFEIENEIEIEKAKQKKNFKLSYKFRKFNVAIKKERNEKSLY